MIRSKFLLFACVLGSSLSLCGIETPRSKGEPQVQSDDSQNVPQLVVTNASGEKLVAKKRADKLWEVSGMDLKGTIAIDTEAGSATFQSSLKTSPLQSITVTVNGTLITTLINPQQQKRVVTGSPEGYTEQVDVMNSSGNTLTAKRSSEGVWKITGADMSGKEVNGILAIDPNTGFVAYKGSNGSFMYKKSIPIEKIVGGMASTKKPISNKMVKEDIVDKQIFPDVSSDERIEVKQLIQAVLEKDGD
jgi:hypothetical protein